MPIAKVDTSSSKTKLMPSTPSITEFASMKMINCEPCFGTLPAKRFQQIYWNASALQPAGTCSQTLSHISALARYPLYVAGLNTSSKKGRSRASQGIDVRCPGRHYDKQQPPETAVVAFILRCLDAVFQLRYA